MKVTNNTVKITKNVGKNKKHKQTLKPSRITTNKNAKCIHEGGFIFGKPKHHHGNDEEVELSPFLQDFAHKGKAGSETSSGHIYAHGNDVYFNVSIDTASIIALQKVIQEVLEGLYHVYNGTTSLGFKVEYPPIVLHINSPGGVVFAAFVFIDFMTQMRKKYGVKFHTVIEGRAASAATLISVTADRRYITEYGYMLIHQLWGASIGKYNEIKDGITNIDTLMDRIKQIYKTHTKVPEEHLDKILEHDIYWDAKKCKKYALVDEILR